jgi:2-acylglycerol O-acyltransferase 2
MSEDLTFHSNPIIMDEAESFDSEGSDSVLVNKPANKAHIADSNSNKESISPSSPATQKKPKIQFAPLKVPLTRRRQTFMLVMFFLMPWLLSFILYASLYYFTGIIRYLIIIYIGWMLLFQSFPQRGGSLRQDWFRNLICWKWFCDFFPMHLHKTVDLPNDRSYIFGFHPHGILSFSAFGNFATNGTGFQQLFPGIKLSVLTLTVNFKFPLYGFYLAALGMADASRESCNYVLRKGKGNSVLLVLGGAKESLDAHPGQYVLTLKNRKGFVKVGLENGASLVPVFSFGKTEFQLEFFSPSLIRLIDSLLSNFVSWFLLFLQVKMIYMTRFPILVGLNYVDGN